MKRVITVLVIAVASLVIVAGSASAHVHLITPLRCVDAAPQAGAAVPFGKVPAAPLTARDGSLPVIPVLAGGQVLDHGQGANAAVCGD